MNIMPSSYNLRGNHSLGVLAYFKICQHQRYIEGLLANNMFNR